MIQCQKGKKKAIISDDRLLFQKLKLFDPDKFHSGGYIVCFDLYEIYAFSQTAHVDLVLSGIDDPLAIHIVYRGLILFETACIDSDLRVGRIWINRYAVGIADIIDT